MAPFFDPTTMFLALVASTLAAALLLLWTYFLNRGERSLLFVALGFLLVCGSNVFFANRNGIPPVVAIAGSGGLILLGTSCTWVAARVFNGRPFSLYVLFAAPVLWLLACLLPVFVENFSLRAVIGSLIPAGFMIAAAREILLKDGLRTRYALAAALAIHAGTVLLRIPFVIASGPVGPDAFAAPWVGAAALEGVIFIQVVAFLMVSLAKERLEMRLRLAAFTDPLTGLGNRRAFFERSQPIVSDDARLGRSSATIVFDLDRFKEINDQHGHPVGDAVLQTFASTARRFLRPGDFAGRLGGEEFAITLPDTSSDNARQVAERITRAFEQAVAAMSGQALHCTASAGVVASSEEVRSLDQLLSAADRALYEAKDLGGGQVRLGNLSKDGTKGRAA